VDGSDDAPPAGQPSLAPDPRPRAFHTALRAAIEARGLTLERLQDRLAQRGIHVSAASLSYWQHGRTRPERPDSLRALEVLEEVLGTPAGALAALLGPRRPRGPRSLRGTLADRPEELMGVGAPLSRLLDELPGSRHYDLDLVSQHETVLIDAQRRISEVTTKALAAARRDGIDRYFVVYAGDPGCDAARMRVEAIRDCTVGRVLRDPEAGILVGELLFGWELARGETHVFEFRVLDGTAESTMHSHGFRYRVDQFVLQVRFDAAALPVAVEGFVQSTLDGEPRPTGALRVTPHHTAQLTCTDATPGGIGISWAWNS
jgi:transcriptional regulator with XRE-family HTH domain